ncbi:MAG: hypothetical protein WC494_01650 [Candidatus Pacearchaeota archaeon]
MIDIKEKKGKIISFLESNGPSLPVRIAKVIEMEPVFASAILSELYNERRIKMSFIKVGSSRLYFLPGQEQKLEEHTENLKPVEKEAYLKIKDKKILKDEDEEPAVRVALRNLKDFAESSYENNALIWKYKFFKEETKEPKKKIEEVKKPRKIEEKIEIFDSEKKESEFSSEIKQFLDKKEIGIIEEIQSNKKELIAKVSVKTSIGEVNFLLIAKNKKSTNKEEINTYAQRAGYYKMPCLIILKKEASKTIKNYLKENNLIKIISIEEP